MYVITVTFTIKPDHLSDFMAVMLKNSKISLEKEKGCHQFDVCVDPENPNVVFLYELYTGKSAFEAHLASAHFNEFNKKTANWIEIKDVRAYEKL